MTESPPRARAVPPVGRTWVGPHTIIPEHLRRAPADEKGAVVVESIRPGFGVRHRELQVLRCDGVAGQARVFLGLAHDDPPVRECCPRRGCGREILELALDLSLDPRGELRVHRDQDWHRVGIMLRLRKQIRRNPGGVGRCVGDDHQFRRGRQAYRSRPVRRAVVLRPSRTNSRGPRRHHSGGWVRLRRPGPRSHGPRRRQDSIGPRYRRGRQGDRGRLGFATHTDRHPPHVR